jgi:hypothetical protein
MVEENTPAGGMEKRALGVADTAAALPSFVALAVASTTDRGRCQEVEGDVASADQRREKHSVALGKEEQPKLADRRAIFRRKCLQAFLLALFWTHIKDV